MSAPSNRTTSSALLQALEPEQVLRLNHLAGQWHVRRQQADWSDADEQALQSWLAQDPTHRAALDGVQRTWQDAQQLKAMFAASYGHQPAAATTTSTAADVDAAPSSLPTASRSAARQSRSATSWWRRPSFSTVLASCFVALVLAGYGWHRWDNTASYTLEIATAPGELRTIDLPDGSRVALNANSHLQVRFYPRRRATVLDQGEAFFEVAADQAKPFTVDSGSSQVRVVGTAFNVRAAPPELLVQVQEGRVEVRSTSNAQAPVLVLGPGTGVAIDPASGQRRKLPVAPEAIAEWRTGQIYFKRAPLQWVADELSRYLGQPVEVDGTAIQALPISGLLALKEPERFLLALPSVAKVRVQQREKGGWRISPQ